MLTIKASDLEKFIKIRRRMSDPTAKPGSSAKPVLFLSTCFHNTPQLSESARLIRDSFAPYFSVTEITRPAGGLQLSKVLREIQRAAVVLVDVTRPVPNVMLELGMAFALAPQQRKRVYMCFNKDVPEAQFRSLPDYIRSLDIIIYTFAEDTVREARDRIHESLQSDPEPEEILQVNMRGTNLRPNSNDRGVFVSYPKDRHIWDQVIPRLRTALEQHSLALYTGRSTPAGSGFLEEVIYSTCRSSKKLAVSCFVDTTNSNMVDLVGAFALGAATANKRGARRLVEKGMDHGDRMSLWTEQTFEWDDIDQLIEHIVTASRLNAK